MVFFLCLAATSFHGPGTYAHYSSATNISDDVQVDHIWEVIPSPSERDGNYIIHTPYAIGHNKSVVSET